LSFYIFYIFIYGLRHKTKILFLYHKSEADYTESGWLCQLLGAFSKHRSLTPP
jgi:hypothetical protein